MFEILPSLASANPLCLGEALARLGPCAPLHLDIEDGNFIPNITFGLKTVAAVAAAHTGPLNAHILATSPEDYLAPLSSLGVACVAAHIEALPYPMRFLRHAKSLHMRVGLAFNMKTPLREALCFVSQMDYALIMTSEADYGDQAFFPGAPARLKEARSLFPAGMALWADGGITAAHVPALCSLGVTAAVMGRALFEATDPRLAMEEYRSLAHDIIRK